MEKRFSILIDGGFFVRRVQKEIGRRPEVDDVVSAIEKIRSHSLFAGFDLLRVYYYDARPATGKLKNPSLRKKRILQGPTYSSAVNHSQIHLNSNQTSH